MMVARKERKLFKKREWQYSGAKNQQLEKESKRTSQQEIRELMGMHLIW